MRTRTVLAAAVLLAFLRCKSDPTEDPNDSSGSGGKGTSGSSGSPQGGASGTTNGAGEGGEAPGGASGTAQGGASGNAQGGSSGAVSGRGGGGSSTGGAAGAGGAGVDEDTVTGTVMVNAHTPVEGALVAIGAALTMTDADGYFQIPNVAPRYDVVLVQPDETYALVVRGVTTRSLNLPGSGFGDAHDGGISGRLSGAGVPISQGHVAHVTFLSPETDYPQQSFVGDDALYGLVSYWFGPRETTGDMYAIAFQVDEENRVVDYDGFGTKRVTLSRADGVGGPDDPATQILLDNLSGHRVTGGLSAPAEFVSTLRFFVGPLYTDYFEVEGSSYSTLLPVVSGLPNFVEVESLRELVNGTEVVLTNFHIGAGTVSMNLTSVDPPALGTPEEAEVIGTNTTFRWTNSPNSVAKVTFRVGDWSINLVTTLESATIPNLEEYGVTLEPGAEGRWEVMGTLAVDDADEWLGAERLTYQYIVDHDGSGYTNSGFRTFTLAE